MILKGFGLFCVFDFPNSFIHYSGGISTKLNQRVSFRFFIKPSKADEGENLEIRTIVENMKWKKPIEYMNVAITKELVAQA